MPVVHGLKSIAKLPFYTLIGVVVLLLLTGTLASPSPVLASGIEHRWVDYAVPGERGGKVLVVKVDPNAVNIKAHYQKRTFRNVTQWASALNNPLLVVNANFFERSNPVGIVFEDGVRKNYASNHASAGSVEITGGQVRFRVFAGQRYRGEKMDQAVEGFPVLLRDGKAVYTFYDVNMTASEQRTVIAEDAAHNLYILIFYETSARIRPLANWLEQSGLGLVNAVNMDGGISTQIFIAGGPTLVGKQSAGVSVVLAVYGK
jgi:exopolysaccharide biosynthesis protein